MDWYDVPGSNPFRVQYRDNVFPTRVAAEITEVWTPSGFRFRWWADAVFKGPMHRWSGEEGRKADAKIVARRVVFNGSPRCGG